MHANVRARSHTQNESMQGENETIANQTMNTITNNTHLYKL